MNPAENDRLRRAALLVAALDADTADALLDRLPAEHAGLVRRMLVELDDVDPHEQRTIIQAFIGRGTPSGNAAAGVEFTSSAAVAESVTPPSAPSIEPADDAPFRFLHEAASEDLCELLAGERPQTVAVVVSHLPADRAAAALACLPDELQADVMRRLAVLHETDPAVLADIEQSLELRFRRRFPSDRRSTGVVAVQEILSEAAPEVRRTLLTNIARNDPRLAERLTTPTLTFVDLPRLAEESLLAVLETASDDYVVPALAGADLDFVRRLTAALPRQVARRLQSAVDSLGPTRLSDVELAQEHLVRTARELEASGRLQWRDAAATPTARQPASVA